MIWKHLIFLFFKRNSIKNLCANEFKWINHTETWKKKVCCLLFRELCCFLNRIDLNALKLSTAYPSGSIFLIAVSSGAAFSKWTPQTTRTARNATSTTLRFLGARKARSNRVFGLGAAKVAWTAPSINPRPIFSRRYQSQPWSLYLFPM